MREYWFRYSELAPSWRRQPYDESCAGDRRQALFVHRSGPVLGPDAPAMGLDDLLGDRQSKPRILAEALMRAVGIEALEDPQQSVLADAGTVVVDHDLDLGADAATGDSHGAARCGKGLRVRQQVRDHLSQPRIMPRHCKGIADAAALETDLDG